MTTPALAASPTPADFIEIIREDHLRLAVLLDLIEDELAEAKPLAGRLAQLRVEYERHCNREEQMLARIGERELAGHQQGHDHMRTLLARLSAAHDSGQDIRELLSQVVGLFTNHLLPADTIFMSEKLPSSRS